MRRYARWLAILLIAAIALPTLAACGKRGHPQPPPGSKGMFPRTYPNPNHD
ncbi:MAG: hypothetical protein ACREFD_03125 [Stellaceae bacterium]